MKRSADIRWSEVRIGIFLLVSLTLLSVGIFMVGQKTRFFSPKKTVAVVLPNVQGLKIGAPVWLSGVVIGTVAEVEFTHPQRSDEVTVTLEIEGSAARRLGKGAEVTIRTRGLLGEKYVDIRPGKLSGPLPPGPIRGVAPQGLDETLGEAYSDFEKLGRLVESVESGEGSLGKFLRDPALYDGLVQLSGQLQGALAAASEGEGTMSRLLNDPTLYRRLSSLSEKGEAAAGELLLLAREMRQGEGTLGRLVKDPALYRESLAAAGQARKALEELDGLLAALKAGEGTAGKLMTESELHDRLVTTLGELETLLRDIREHPERYVRVSLF